MKNLLIHFLPFWKVRQKRLIMSMKICKWRNFLWNSGNLSRLLCVYHPLCQPIKLKFLWRLLLPSRSKVIWRDSEEFEECSLPQRMGEIFCMKKKYREKPLPLMKNRNHCLGQLSSWVFLVNTLFLWHFLWVFLVNTHTHTTMELKRTKARPIAQE